MSCFHPILAVDNGIDPETGKHRIKMLPRRPDINLERMRSLYGDSLMMLPCGHCVACAQEYARMWQSRIMCEAQYWDKKCFVTLTYAEERAPNKDDFRDFIDRLTYTGGKRKPVKFFACGELGSKTKRFHMHAILFGFDFAEDRQIIAKRGLNYVYRSKILENAWKHGYCSFGELDIASAGYVSKYCDKKKITSHDDGEFVMMSRGLGRKYYEEHKNGLFDSDKLYFKGNKFKIPRYFLTLARNDDFYIATLADDLLERKKKVANQFSYYKGRSFVYEEEAMIESARVALDKKKSQEGVRDVL